MAFGNSFRVKADLVWQAIGISDVTAANRRVEQSTHQAAAANIRDYKNLSKSALELARAQEQLQRAERSGSVYRAAGAQQRLLEIQERQAAAANKTTAAVKREERAFDRLTRGAIAGSGAFASLGRAAAFSSGTFLGGLGLAFAIRSSVKAAEDHQAALAQLSAALKAAGIDEAKYGRTIEETLRQQRLLTGFTEEQTTRAFTLLARTTGSVESGFRALKVAQNVALGANIGLEIASLKVARAFNGQARGITALGAHLTKGVKGYQALNEIQAIFAGSAEAASHTAAVAQRRFGQALHETEITIGTVLLPTLTKYLNKGSEWLGQSRNQERIQKDVNAVVHTAGTVIHDMSRFIGRVNTVLHPFVRLVGGAGKALELAFGLAIGLKLKAFLATTRLLGPAAVTAAAQADAAINSIGNTALANVPKVEALAAAESTLAGRINQYGVNPGIPGGVPKPGFLSFLGRSAKILPASVAGALGFLTLGQQGEQGNKPILAYNPKTDTYRLVYSGAFSSLSRNVSSEEARKADPAAWQKFETAKAKANTLPAATTDSYTDQFQGKSGKKGGGPARLDTKTALDQRLASAKTQGETLSALAAEVTYYNRYIAIQRTLEKKALAAGDAVKAKQHAETVTRLLGERSGYQGQIDSINQQNAADAKAKRDEAARQAAQRARDYRSGLQATQLRLAARVHEARTSAGRRRAEAALETFLRKEARDPKLRPVERERYHNTLAAAQERERNARLADERKAAENKILDAVTVADIARRKAREGSAAYDKAEKAEEAALRREIAFYAHRAALAKKGSAARRKALQEENAAQKALGALTKKDKGAAADFRKLSFDFLTTLHGFDSQYGSNIRSAPAMVVVNQHFPTPTPDRNREAIYARHAVESTYRYT